MSAVLPAGMANPTTQNDADLAARLPTPAERLQQSRERIAQWMIQADGGRMARRRAAAAAGVSGSDSGWAWLGSLRNNRVVALVLDAISSWWVNHPMHPVADLAEGIARDAVAPLARRHPRAMVAGAFVIGALLVWAKPWRRLIKPALFTGILAQVASHVIAQVPIDSILSTITAFAAPREPPPGPSPEVAQAAATAAAAVEESADA
jgi:hypothetical protein